MHLYKHATTYTAACVITVYVCLLSCVLPTVSSAWDGHSIPGAPHVLSLRKETEELFYHGFENYMRYAFPEDEVRPQTCKPLTRDAQDPNHLELNDALGNYSLTLVDTLSTLAILASTPSDSRRNKPLLLFQNAIKDLVEQYGDGTHGPSGQGRRARGFDLDSKVQVFETSIRGLGGLLSAHLFAVGELPIRGYDPPVEQARIAQVWNKQKYGKKSGGIKWANGFVYDGQLLRLAHDLGSRLIPAFWTSTGIPYPRVNLRHGIPFYANSPNNYDPESGQCSTNKKPSTEITETCSAGAGSLVLEFTVLSRLTGDPRFEDLAKRAFWAIWTRRSEIDLIGAGIDAETGIWVYATTGIGAGVDSFFEYALKSHILLAQDVHPTYNESIHATDPRVLFSPLSDYEHSSKSFLDAWEDAHAAIKRQLYRGPNFQHPHYIQADITTGAARAFWVDSLSAYYPGLLTLAGYLDEAIETHLFTTALWTRFAALPERYNLLTGGIEGGLGWWVGRPEFIESNYLLYRATEDPWYIYVGEMALRDIKRRCWARCGWSGIQNVLTGETSDRMESFFLGETAKYLFLLFDPSHPLNRLDAPFVFSTEGHPLIIPRSIETKSVFRPSTNVEDENSLTCPIKSNSMPFSFSQTAARGDVYHAASLARLHLMPQRTQEGSTLGEYASDRPSITMSDIYSPSNYSYFPWTLPPELVPHDAQSSLMPTHPTFEVAFPTMQNQASNSPPLQRVKEGLLINFIGGLRLSMVQDTPLSSNDPFIKGYRIYSINNVALGKDEKVYLARDVGYGVLNPADPNFTRMRDSTMLDIVIDVDTSHQPKTHMINDTAELHVTVEAPQVNESSENTMKAAWHALVAQISSLMLDRPSMIFPFNHGTPSVSDSVSPNRFYIPAITPTGIGAALLPDWIEASSPSTSGSMEARLPWITLYATDELCDRKLPLTVPRTHQIIVLKRGGCSFSKKLSNIPATVPSSTSLHLVIIVSDELEEDAPSQDYLTRPLLDEAQVTSSGLPRQYPLHMVMVGGGEKTYEALKLAHGVAIKRRYSIQIQGVPLTNLVII